MNRIIYFILVAFTLSAASFATEHQRPPKQEKWSFDGIFGTIDRQSAQRGYQVYKEVCSTCHSMHQIAYRNLATPKNSEEGLGFSEAEVKSLAKEFKVKDINDTGDEIERDGLPSDHFNSPYPNDKAAKAANNGAAPPDLSLMVKAREDGANYIHAILNGYEDPPANVKPSPTQHYNPYFPGGLIAMPPPLSDGLVTYSDGTKATIDQMSRDIVNFLQWTAEPEMEARKRMGIKVTIFLSIFTILFYLAKKIIWARIEKE